MDLLNNYTLSEILLHGVLFYIVAYVLFSYLKSDITLLLRIRNGQENIDWEWKASEETTLDYLLKLIFPGLLVTFVDMHLIYLIFLVLIMVRASIIPLLWRVIVGQRHIYQIEYKPQ